MPRPAARMAKVMAMLSGIATSNTAGKRQPQHADRDEHRGQQDKPDQIALA